MESRRRVISPLPSITTSEDDDKPTGPPPLVLLLGGSGYIGTHLMLALHGRGYQVAIVDLKAPSQEAVDYAEKQSEDHLPVISYIFDLETLNGGYPAMPRTPFCGIMLAALKDVNEGEKIPFDYMRTNLTLCVNSMEYLNRLGVKHLIQASSSTVYHTVSPDNKEPTGVYGYTKRVSEDICRRLLQPDQGLLIARYMNPIGSHPYVKAFPDIGICEKLVKLKPGDTFVNRGNCIRDYIHITDLAQFHVHVLEQWSLSPGIGLDHDEERVTVLDVGSGVKTSVEELLKEWDKHLGKRTLTTLSWRLRHEGYDTTSTSDAASYYLPEWWGRQKKSLCESLMDYQRRGI